MILDLARTVTTAPAPELPVARLDFERLGRLADLERKSGRLLLDVLTQSLAASARELLATAQAPPSVGDADQLRFDAHRLKGSALNLGAGRVGELAHAIEKSARGGHDVDPRQLRELGAEVDAAISALTSWRSAGP